MAETGSAAAAANEVPCCWLCLSEQPDESTGKPLVRDCSCRGSSGFAHANCIIRWAENEFRRSNKGDGFRVCPNCKQLYRNELQNELSKAHVLFVEREYAMDDSAGVSKHATALANRMALIDCEKEEDRVEGEEICKKLLQSVEFTKHDNSRSWSTLQGAIYVAIASYHMQMGCRFGYTEWPDSLKKAKEYYALTIDVYKIDNDDVGIQQIEKLIAIIESRLNGVERRVDNDADINIKRETYNFFHENLGQDHTTTINSGVSLASILFESFSTIEAERLVAKLHQISHRVHGVEHNSTTDALSLLQHVKVRSACVRSRPGDIFQALRYESDDKKIVLQGPVKRPRNIDMEQSFEEKCENVVFVDGTPVICHGLQKATQLNGKIGNVKDLDEESDRYTIHFEDKSLKPAKVKRGNLRIIFDLPDAAE